MGGGYEGRDRKRSCSSQARNNDPHNVETSRGKREGGYGTVGENCRGDDCTIQQRSVCACGCACVCVSRPIQDYGTLPP